MDQAAHSMRFEALVGAESSVSLDFGVGTVLGTVGEVMAVDRIALVASL